MAMRMRNTMNPMSQLHPREGVEEAGVEEEGVEEGVVEEDGDCVLGAEETTGVNFFKGEATLGWGEFISIFMRSVKGIVVVFGDVFFLKENILQVD
jgi:hypothetical protein